MNNVAKTSGECRQRFVRDSILTPQFISGLKKMGKYTRVQLPGNMAVIACDNEKKFIRISWRN